MGEAWIPRCPKGHPTLTLSGLSCMETYCPYASGSVKKRHWDMKRVRTINVSKFPSRVINGEIVDSVQAYG